MRGLATRMQVDLGTLGDSLPDALIMMDLDCIVVSFNSGAEALFRSPRDAIIGQHLEVLIPSRFREIHRQHVQRFALESEMRALSARSGIEMIGLRRDGSEFPADVSMGPMVTDQGSFVGVIVRDVSERLAHERIVLAAKAKDDFFANVSHELRTPLTAIIGYCELIDEADDPSEVAAFVKVIERNALRQQRLVEDLLFLTSIEGAIRPDRGEVADLVRVVHKALDQVSSALGAADLKVEVVAPGIPPMAAFAPGLMAEAFTKILSNAMKFSSPGSTVRILITATRTTAEVRFVDTGPGIPPSDVDHVFDRLFRGSYSQTNEVQGAGLGLTIARKILGLFDGTVIVEPHDAPGTCILVSLPLAVG